MPDLAVQLFIALFTVLASIGVAYYTATHAARQEKASGQARLLELCRRYALIFYNSIDVENGSIRNDELSYRVYMGELLFIVNSLDELLANVYVESLILRHPDVTKMLVLLRRELREHEQAGRIETLNMGAIAGVLALAKVVRRDLKSRTYNKSFDSVLDELESVLRTAGLIPT